MAFLVFISWETATVGSTVMIPVYICFHHQVIKVSTATWETVLESAVNLILCFIRALLAEVRWNLKAFLIYISLLVNHIKNFWKLASFFVNSIQFQSHPYLICLASWLYVHCFISVLLKMDYFLRQYNLTIASLSSILSRTSLPLPSFPSRSIPFSAFHWKRTDF